MAQRQPEDVPGYRSELSDRELGMDRPITRRDFLDGVAIAVGALSVGGMGASSALAGERGGRAPYPPELTGLRGSHAGSFEVAHALRDGTFWDHAGRPCATGEEYDLVVVGAGISGLAAAHFHLRDVNPRARILILDPHDDFGGHAKRNELTVDGRTLIGYGGSQSIDTPSSYRSESMQLLVDVGIDVKRFEEFFDQSYYQRHGAAGRAYLFMKESWGRDHLVVRHPGMKMGEIFADAPMAPQARADLAMLYDDPPDWVAGMTQEQKLAELRRHYVGHFVQKYASPHPDAYKFLLRTTGTGIGVQYDQFGALDGASGGTTGLTGIELDRSQGPWYGLARTGQRFWYFDDPYIHHFPDGNAGVARALVRKLIPEALPGSTMEDLVTTRCDYRRLDRRGNRVRIRLRSTVARVRHLGRPDRARALEVAYVQDGELRRVKAHGVVMTTSTPSVTGTP